MATSRVFDVAGPVQRRRIRIATTVSVVIMAILAAVVIQKLHYEAQLLPQKWRVFYDPGFIRYTLQGFVVTLWVSVVSLVTTVLCGIVLALGRLSRWRIVSIPATGLIEFFRAMPFLLILFAVMFGLPVLGVNLGAYWQLVVAITINGGALFAEVFRAGIQSIPRGQTEAGLATGIPARSVFGSIVFPQAVRNTAPALLSQAVRVVKESSLGFIVGLGELMNHARIISEYTGNFIQAYLAAGVLFVIVNGLLSWGGHRLSQRFEPA